jgi:hypothetical protein
MVSPDEREKQAQDERRRQYEAELEPRVAAAAPKVGGANRVLLGPVSELVPSRTDEEETVPAEDQVWYQALGAVAHRYGLTYELITAHPRSTLWLIPPPGAR